MREDSFLSGGATTLIFIVDETTPSIPFNNLLERGRATRRHDIGVQILADVNATEAWLEQHV